MKKRKPSQSEQFDLNAVPCEPSNWLVGTFYVLASVCCVGGVALAFSAFFTLGIGAFVTGCGFAATAQVLRHVHYMRELAEWQAERSLEMNRLER